MWAHGVLEHKLFISKDIYLEIKNKKLNVWWRYATLFDLLFFGTGYMRRYITLRLHG
jgi:hypothetical protein